MSAWELDALNNRFFDVAKFTVVTPLLLLSSCGVSFPVFSFKIFSLPTFALKSPNRIFKLHLGRWPVPVVAC